MAAGWPEERIRLMKVDEAARKLWSSYRHASRDEAADALFDCLNDVDLERVDQNPRPTQAVVEPKPLCPRCYGEGFIREGIVCPCCEGSMVDRQIGVTEHGDKVYACDESAVTAAKVRSVAPATATTGGTSSAASSAPSTSVPVPPAVDVQRSVCAHGVTMTRPCMTCISRGDDPRTTNPVNHARDFADLARDIFERSYGGPDPKLTAITTLAQQFATIANTARSDGACTDYARNPTRSTAKPDLADESYRWLAEAFRGRFPFPETIQWLPADTDELAEYLNRAYRDGLEARSETAEVKP